MEPNGTLSDEDGKPGENTSASLKEKKYSAKVDAIHEACKWKDVEALRTLAASEGGLVSDDLRHQAWPLLLGYASDVSTPKSESDSSLPWTDLPRHRDEDQVQLDVDRSFIYYPNNQSSQQILRRKGELSDLIREVLRRQPYLCYFQGYHDICQVLLLVLQPHERTAAVARLSALRIRDFMLPTLAPALAQLRLIPAILHVVNPRLCAHLSQTEPFFALSGTLTMYAHDIQEYGDIARLFDVFLAREAVFSVYMFVSIVLQRADELFETPYDEPEMLHSILSKLPKPLNLESLIANTATLIEKYPPTSLRTWRQISEYSVLKTSRYPDQTTKQTLANGEDFFRKQVTELRWADRREKILQMVWAYRKTAGTVGLAVLVGVLSFWFRKRAPLGLFGGLWRQYLNYQGH